ncbi:hypothetical protein [Verrucomicrobium sp. BvORR034]|uniref:hypothetical protein n=1 Tax=Verrucomicrobium sp. BvORR034 TaxID=1396418 RepID=UPI000679DDB4|nr:hypothetical protein [Verrucomicrobium sp. BvORR034]
MAFSFRSFFGKDKPDDGSAGSSAMTSSPQSHQGGYPFQKGNQTGTYSTKDVFLGASTPANGNGANYHGSSPFSPATSVPSTGLTVEDILPSLPPDVVKPGGVSPGQPLQIPNELLERALRSGQAALPLFEIYRVCPALFRTPIAPQDARFVSLPPHKLGGLAALMHKQLPPQAPAPTPHAGQPLFMGGNPFQQAAEPPAGGASGETTLFHPSPFHVEGVNGPAQPPLVPPQTAQPMPPSTVQTPFNAFSQFGAPAPAEAPASPQDAGERSGAPLPNAVAGNPFAPSPAVTSSSSTSPFPPMPGGAGQPFAPFGQPAPATSPFGTSNPEPMPPVPAFFGTPPDQPEQAPPATISPPVSPLFTFSHSAPTSPAAAPQPAPTSASPFGNFLPGNPPVAQDAFLSPPASAPQSQAQPQFPPAAPNPFFQPPSSTSDSAGVAPALTPSPASAPGPTMNPFASFGLPPEPVPAPPVQPMAAESAPPNGMAPWQAFSPTPSPAPPSAPEVPSAPFGNAFSPSPSAFPEAPPAPVSANPFDRIKALSSLPDPSANAMPAAPQGLFGPAPAPVPANPQPTAPVPPTPPPVFPGVPSPLAEATPASIPSPAPAKEKAIFSLATVLSRCSEQEIGVKPEQIPSWITVGFPITTLVDQLASGRVTVKLAEIMRGLEPEFRSIITPSRPDIVVELPINDVFHALPSTATPAGLPLAQTSPESMPVIPAEASAPPITKSADVLGSEALAAMAAFKPASAADSPESQAALPSLFNSVKPEEKETTSQLPSGVPWPFEAAPSLPETDAPAAASQALFFGNPIATEDPPAVPPSYHQQPKAEPVLAPEPPAPLFQATSSLLGLPVDPPASSRSIRSEAISFGPGVKAEFTANPPAHLRASRDRNKQLLLRVLLSTEDDLELEDVIRLTGALPGVSAAVCLQEGTIMGYASNGTSEAENFIRQATQIYGHLQPLIQLTGIMDTETLSMKSDQLMASFSLQGELVLGVLHDPGKNEPTLRERITLIARELKAVVGAAS